MAVRCFLLALISLVSFAGNEERLLSHVRQLTFEGKRAGEGYFGPDSKTMVFQSERIDENPFYQIFHMDMETGDIALVSPGYGKTTCAWVHPSNGGVLFASTHLDPESKKKQEEELAFRASGKERRYSWDYDEHYELFHADSNGNYTRLTDAVGYDAEASYSPDGSQIVFASNRLAYRQKMSDEDRELFEKDAAYMMDIYIMNADGSNIRQLTKSKGYDGGPFFSADGKRICWRRFAPNGATAEIYTMNIDGSDQRQLTKLSVMSWAPYFHPSGEYLIFTTNVHGFANFELYLVDPHGKKEPVRVTDTDGFDGLPVFTPDGKTLSWTRKKAGKSQIWMANWNHDAALELLGVKGSQKSATASTKSAIEVNDLRQHVEILASEEMEGRMTGTAGERKATEYVAKVFEELGLEPAGDNGSYFQEFPLVAGVNLGSGNKLTVGKKQYEVDQDWRPMAFSKTGTFDKAPVVFAGYGIVAPADGELDEYDSFVHLDVKDKWVLVLRFMPEDVEASRRQQLNRYAALRYKAMILRDKGALGMLVCSGPRSKVKDELVKLAFDASLSGTSIPALSISNEIAEALFQGSEKSLKTLQETLDKGDVIMGIELKHSLAAKVDIQQEKRIGRNVVARLSSGQKERAAVVLGAHVDHLGHGNGGGSLARDDERGQIHYGADDNASGVAGMLEIAQYLVDQKQAGRLKMKRDMVFAAWSGEELGLLGSAHFTKNYAGKSIDKPLRPEISAYLNLDMIGRLNENLILQGLGSSSYWTSEIERRNAPIGLPIITQKDSYLPTDATSFYVRGVPILAAFTGSHEEYHSPRDLVETLNFEGMTRISKFMGLVARSLLMTDKAPDYIEMTRPENKGQRTVMRAYLGTVPDYAQGDVKGVKLSGVAKGGPAEQAGLRGGDVIVFMAGKKIENIYDYTYAISAVKVGEESDIHVMRNGELLKLTITPGSRD